MTSAVDGSGTSKLKSYATGGGDNAIHQQGDEQGDTDCPLPLPSVLLHTYRHCVEACHGHGGKVNSTMSENVEGENDEGGDGKMIAAGFESPEDLISQSIFSLMDVMTNKFILSDKEYLQHEKVLQATPNLDRDIKVIPIICFRRAFKWFDTVNNVGDLSSFISESNVDKTVTTYVPDQINAAISLWILILSDGEDNRSKNGSKNDSNGSNNKRSDDDPKLAKLAPHEVIRLSLESLSIISSSSGRGRGGLYDNDNYSEEDYNGENLHDALKRIVEQSFATAVVLRLQTLALHILLVDLEDHETIQCKRNSTSNSQKAVTKKDNNRTSKKIRWRRITSMVEQNLETMYKGIILPLEEFVDSISSFHRWFQLHLDAQTDDDIVTTDVKRNDNTYMNQLFWLSKQCDPALEVINHVFSSATIQTSLQVTSAISKHYRTFKSSEDDTAQKEETAQRVPLMASVAFVGLVSQFVDLANKVQTRYFECERLLHAKDDIDGSKVVLLTEGTDGPSIRDKGTQYSSLIGNISSLLFVKIPYIMLHEILLHPVRLEYTRKQEERAEQRMAFKRKKPLKNSNGEDDDEMGFFEEENLTLFQNRMERFRTNTSRLFTERAAIQWNVKGIALAVYFYMTVSHNNENAEKDIIEEKAKHSSISLLPNWHVYSPTMKWCFLWPQISILLTENETAKAFELANSLNYNIPQNLSVGCWNRHNTCTDGNLCQASSGPYYVKPSTEGVMGLVSTMQLWFNVITKNSTTTTSGTSSDSNGNSILVDNGKIIQILKSFLRRINSPSIQVDCIQLLLDRSPYPRLVPILLDFLRIPISKFVFSTDEEVNEKDDPRLKVLNTLKPYVDEMDDYCKDAYDDISNEAMYHQLMAAMDSYETYQATISLIALLTRDNGRNNTLINDMTTNDESDEAQPLLKNFVTTAKKLGRKLAFQLHKKRRDGTPHTYSKKESNPMKDLTDSASPHIDPLISPPPELAQENLFRLNLLLHSVDTLNEI